MTSHDCVGRVRRLLGIKRVGHAGTLDPLAIGVLPMALGRATRLLQFLPQDKAYEATIRLGMATTTDDLAGETLAVASAVDLDLETVKAVLQQFQGKIQQVPPLYSAIQIQGQRLYDLARAGKSVAIQARTVEIYSVEILDWRPGDLPEIDLAIACGPGTYIRAIARDLGKALGTGGTLAALARTQSSGFSGSESLSFEDLEQQIQAQTFTPVPAEVALKHLPAIYLSAEIAQRWCWGQKVDLDPEPITESTTKSINASGFLRVHHQDGQFLGIGQPQETLLVPKVVYQPQ